MTKYALNSEQSLLKLQEAKLLLNELDNREKARESLLEFIRFTKPDYSTKWFHELICKKLDAFEKGNIKKLMLFLPPQHGKTEIVSRRFPSYLLGKDPNRRIALTSYSSTIAEKLNRDVQRIIDDKSYHRVFPETTLNESNVVTLARGGYLRNSEMFEVVGYTGFLKTVGVEGSLTSTTVDIGIIDDPFKDRKTANSQTVRNNVWDWYVDVFESRFHNGSQQLLLMTRWHEDDLGGRIKKRDGLLSKDNPDGWEIVSFPGLKEPGNENPEDKRKVGEALWEERHSKKRLERIQKASPATFISLYQQRPAPPEGSILKRPWFTIMGFDEMMAKIKGRSFQNDCFVDGAYTSKNENDPSGLMATVYDGAYMYILDWSEIREEFPGFVSYTRSYASKHNLKGMPLPIRIEPKASGKSLAQTLKNEGLNAIEQKLADGDKIARANDITPFLEAGRCILISGAWNEAFIQNCTVFPNGVHDEAVDNLSAAVYHYTFNKVTFGMLDDDD